MECNKDEALRAKDIAERKLTSRDYLGAKKFAMKAQNLYPGLEGLSQMLAILEIYSCADNKIKGEIDWYRILNVTPSADDETIKKEYRKLALALHPDKNKSVGADGAFKIVSEAWGLLSDKAKRSAYDQRRNLKGVHVKVPSKKGGDSAPSKVNDFHRYTGRAASNAKAHSTSARASATASQPFWNSNSFWTICSICKTNYEYLRIYLNQTLLCPNCKVPFAAKEIPPPAHVSQAFQFTSHQVRKDPNHQVQKGPNQNLTVKDPVSLRKTAAVSQKWNSVQQANEKSKPSVDEKIVEQERLKKRIVEDSMNGYGGDIARRKISQTPTNFGTFGAYNVFNSHKDSGGLDIQSILMKKAKMDIRRKLEEWRTAAETKRPASGKKGEDKNEGKQQSTMAAGRSSLDRDPTSSNTQKVTSDMKSFSSSVTTTNQETDENMSMKVPDPEFYDFDKDRAETSFGENEVWAAYDDDNGMPRYYALIHKVMSTDPFKLKISWLNSRSNSEFGSLNWVESGFPKSCGEFRVGRYEINKSLNSFSHKIVWSKGTRGVISIYPRKGEVWALYRNWSPDWNEKTPDEVVHKYEVVEVLDDYDEEQGVSVIPLVKVPGFRAVFHQHSYPKEVRRIVKEEMFRFSHQIPNYLITGLESPNAPKDCRELDPASTPSDLLQVTADANVTNAMDS